MTASVRLTRSGPPLDLSSTPESDVLAPTCESVVVRYLSLAHPTLAASDTDVYPDGAVVCLAIEDGDLIAAREEHKRREVHSWAGTQIEFRGHDVRDA